MKTTIQITTETIDKVYLLVFKHKDGELVREWEDFEVFAKFEDAQKYMRKEMSRIGDNLLGMVDNRNNDYTYTYTTTKYEASARLFHKSKVIDQLDAYIYVKTVD